MRESGDVGTNGGSEKEAPRLALSDLKSRRRRVDIIKFPGSDIEVGLLYPSCDDQLQAYFAAREVFEGRMMKVDKASAAIFEKEHETQLLLRMLIDPRTKNPAHRVATDADALRLALSPNDREVLLQKYQKLADAELADWGIRTTANVYLGAVAIALGMSDDSSGDDILQRLKGFILGKRMDEAQETEASE